MGAEDDIFKLIRRSVMGVSVLVVFSTGFDWMRYTQSELTASVGHNDAIAPGRLYVDIYAITGANLVEGIAVAFFGLLAIGGMLLFRHAGMKWAVVLAPLCGLAITGIAVYSAIYVSTLAGDVEPEHVRIGYGLWFIVFAGPLILGVSSMMALEVYKPKFWSKFGRASTAEGAPQGIATGVSAISGAGGSIFFCTLGKFCARVSCRAGASAILLINARDLAAHVVNIQEHTAVVGVPLCIPIAERAL